MPTQHNLACRLILSIYSVIAWPRTCFSYYSPNVLFTTAYQPGLDLCTGEGSSRLYGLYYRTGTAFPSPSVLGTYTETISGVDYEFSRSFIDLGQGFATTPSIHTGAGNAGNEVSVFTQLSTGAVIRNEAETVFNVRSGMQAWNEPK